MKKYSIKEAADLFRDKKIVLNINTHPDSEKACKILNLAFPLDGGRYSSFSTGFCTPLNGATEYQANFGFVNSLDDVTQGLPVVCLSQIEDDEDYDFVNPSHYQNSTKEVWEMMVDVWGVEKFIAHCEMCAFKYRQRLGLKPDQPVERDLEKAKWYEDKAKELKK